MLECRLSWLDVASEDVVSLESTSWSIFMFWHEPFEKPAPTFREGAEVLPASFQTRKDADGTKGGDRTAAANRQRQNGDSINRQTAL
jgi:hypothetical protein